MAFEIENGVLKKYTEEKGVTEVIIPDNVKSIGNNVFLNCKSITSITIPDSVTSIGNCAFYGCTGLKNITIPDSVTSIGSTTFAWCTHLTSITFPDSVASIGYSAFCECGKLESITIPDSIISIGDRAFYNCISLKSIIIPNNVKSIGNSAFSNCICLTDITIPDSVISIGGITFNGCLNLKSITIHDNIKSIGKYVFLFNIKIIICKGNVKVPFKFKIDRNIFNQDQLLNDFIVADINDRQQVFNVMTSYYKIFLALFMTFAYPQETYYRDYLKNNAEDAVKLLTDEENIDLLYKFFELGFVTKDNIDSLISYAVEHTQNGGSAEPQLVLTRYKNDNFGCQGADAIDKFML